MSENPNNQRVLNPDALPSAYEFDQLDMKAESVTVTLHRSLLENIANQLLVAPRQEGNKVNSAVRSLGHNLRIANSVLHGAVRADNTLFSELVINGVSRENQNV